MKKVHPYIDRGSSFLSWLYKRIVIRTLIAYNESLIRTDFTLDFFFFFSGRED